MLALHLLPVLTSNMDILPAATTDIFYMETSIKWGFNTLLLAEQKDIKNLDSYGIVKLLS